MKQMYEISKDVPIPTPVKKYHLPYEQLQVGESFWVQDIKMSVLCNLNTRYSKRLSRKFVCRSDKGGVRVWRIA